MPAATASAKPYIVLILIDETGYGDIQPSGSTNCATPALDRMASEGLKLTSLYAAPICPALRARTQTGCYAPRVSIPGVLFPASPTGLYPTEHTVAKLPKAQGYATMAIGKWHLGDQPKLPAARFFKIALCIRADLPYVRSRVGFRRSPRHLFE